MEIYFTNGRRQQGYALGVDDRVQVQAGRGWRLVRVLVRVLWLTGSMPVCMGMLGNWLVIDIVVRLMDMIHAGRLANAEARSHQGWQRKRENKAGKSCFHKEHYVSAVFRRQMEGPDNTTTACHAVRGTGGPRHAPKATDAATNSAPPPPHPRPAAPLSATASR